MGITTKEKAIMFNKNPQTYGSFAEIGAGQEVARAFFRVGGASSTIAKTMSAYDMTFSDSIYGPEENKRYVCESRLNKMLQHEYDLLIERLSKARKTNTTFFAYANTVAAKSTRGNDCHGWMGIRFQLTHEGPFNDIILHIRMHDNRNILQQEAVGTVGINLVYGAFYLNKDPVKLIESLTDGLEPGRIEIDMIRFRGPDFRQVDNRLMALHLVQTGLTHAVMISPNGDVSQPSDSLYGKHVLIQRGSFHPVTHVNMDMLELSRKNFESHLGEDSKKLAVLLELTLSNLAEKGNVDAKDMVNRLDLLGALGFSTLISNYQHYYQLRLFLNRCHAKQVGLVMGVGHLTEIFKESTFANIDGGVVEAVAKLFSGQIKVFVYPSFSMSVTNFTHESNDDKLYQAQNFNPPAQVLGLYKYLLESSQIVDLKGFNKKYLDITSKETFKKIISGDSSWEKAVPTKVAQIIKEKKLFQAG